MFIVSDGDSESAVLLELKDIHLSGLWNGSQGHRTKWTNPSFEEMESLAKEMSSMNEALINEMQYMYWSKHDKRYISTTISNMRKDVFTQMKWYVKVIKKGRAEKFDDSGISDP
jgi:hypothetical protein